MGLTNEAKAVKSASTSKRSCGVHRGEVCDSWNEDDPVRRIVDQLQMLSGLEISIEPPVEIARSYSSKARSKDVGGRVCLVEYRHW